MRDNRILFATSRGRSVTVYTVVVFFVIFLLFFGAGGRWRMVGSRIPPPVQGFSHDSGGRLTSLQGRVFSQNVSETPAIESFTIWDCRD